ncbi:hypothetical protein VE02_04674 [Pseudogymnoascus sp. 03VT05]|nr:hypothetical protein VE02_04674 [Pseudogymnoascus sp. 03VT05]
MSGNPSEELRHRACHTVELGALGLARNAAGTLVHLADRQTEVSTEELEQLGRLLREGYYPPAQPSSPQHHARGRLPAPSRPPGLGPATSNESRQLRSLIPEAEQFWPVEFHQFDPRYAGSSLAPPSTTVTRDGGPILPPPPPAAAPNPAAAAGSQTGRTSRGVHVQLGGYFTVDQLRSSRVVFPPRTMQGGTAQHRPSLAGASGTLDLAGLPSVVPSLAAPPSAALPPATPSSAAPPSAPLPSVGLPPSTPRGPVLHRPQLSASAPAFVPCAATLAAQPAIPKQWTTSAIPAAATTFPSSAMVTANPVPIVNLPRASASVTPELAATPDSPSEDARMVVLRGIPDWMSVANMADSVSSDLYGALYAIEFAPDNGKHSARVIFRDAVKVGIHHSATPGAKGYYDALMAAKAQPWADRSRALWPFPPGCVVEVRLENFPANDWIRGMRPALGEDGKRIQAVSRRLSLVGLEQLFNSFREKEMRRVVVWNGTVRAASIERVCVYNSGNATMVFADVPSAVQALKRFEEYNASAAKETLKVKVSHSKDPCEVAVQYTPNDSFGSQPAQLRPGPKGYFTGKR